MPKIRERNKEAAVFVENDLEGFHTELSCTKRANDSLGPYGIDILCLIPLHGRTPLGRFAKEPLNARQSLLSQVHEFLVCGINLEDSF